MEHNEVQMCNFQVFFMIFFTIDFIIFPIILVM